MSGISVHPFRTGVMMLITKHFEPDIAKRFRLILEIQRYRVGEDEGLWKQKRNDTLVMEIYYRNFDESDVYLCDLYSWWSKKQTEYELLRTIRDAYKDGKIRFSKPDDEEVSPA